MHCSTLYTVVDKTFHNSNILSLPEHSAEVSMYLIHSFHISIQPLIPDK